MSKRRKSAEPELPLFDLPLHGGDGPDSAPAKASAPPHPTKPAAPQPATSQPATSQPATSQPAAPQPTAPPPPAEPLLFSEEELARAQTGRSAPIDDEESETAVRDAEVPLIQDRLLGGLADVTIHLATLGSMIVAVQLMGVPVALADWPAFAGLTLIFSFLYSVVPLAFWGHTPGMAWVGHSARSESDEPLSFPQTAMRWLGSLFTVFLLGLPLLLGLGGRSLADRISDSKTLQR